MALADYFERNAQAATALVSGFDASLLATRLQGEVIGIAFDATVHASSEAQASIDLTLRLLARLYPTLAIAGLGNVQASYVHGLRKLARDINPRIDIQSTLGNATKLLVFGSSRAPVRRRLHRKTWYVGSNNWIAALSQATPQGSGNSTNPLGAGTAACIAAANVFRSVFAHEIGDAVLDSEVRVSLIDMRPATTSSSNPPFPQKIELRDVHLVGAGAIGSGVLWALSRMPCVGQLHVIDPEKVSDSNLQRYVMLTAGDREKEKAPLATGWLMQNGLTVTPHVCNWAAHVANVPEYKVDTAISAVDSAVARIQIQASLPRVIFNGWTQKGEAGVSRHRDFVGPMACLACLYIPKGGAQNEDVLVTRALRLPQDDSTVREVRRRLQLNVPTDGPYLRQIETAASLEPSRLATFENRPLRELYVEGVCGGQVMEFHQAAIQARAEVPMGFQSTFAGLLLAAEFARPAPLTDTITQIDLMNTFPERPGHPKSKTTSPRCLCLDEDFIDVYQSKYGASAAGGCPSQHR